MLSRLYLFCLVFGRSVDRHQHLPARLDLLHAELGRLRRLVLQVARHQVDLLGRQLAGLAPVRHAGRRAQVDEHLQVLGALLLRDVRGQRLAGGALAQHAVAAGAALEVDLLRLLELGLGHVRRARRHEDLHAFRARGRRRALVLELGHGRRVLGRRVGFLRRRGGLGAFRGDLRRRDGPAGVAPGVERVGQGVGDLLVRELRHRRHHGVELGAVDDHFALQAVDDDADGTVLVAEQVVGSGERGKRARQALAVGLVAGEAGDLEDFLARLDLRGAGRGTCNFSLVDCLCPGRCGQCKRSGDRERQRCPATANSASTSWMAPVVRNWGVRICVHRPVAHVRRRSGSAH